MSLPSYPDLVDSASDLTARRPRSWREARLKSVLRQVTDKAESSDWKLALENIESWTGRLLDSTSELEGDGIEFREGDVLFGKLRPYLAKALAAPRAGSAVGDFLVLRPQTDLHPRFLRYLLVSPPVIDSLTATAEGAKMPRTSWSALSELIAPIPSLEEQVGITAFLDLETAKIDALIAEQERLIGLLQEKRQAVISHAVTKGLDPNVPMKDSGVPRIGKVPSHWRVCRLKNAVRGGRGAVKTGPFGSQLQSSDMQQGSIKVYNQRNVIDRDFKSGDSYISQKKFEELLSFETFPGDVLITTRGSIGHCAILPSEAERGVLHPCLMRVQVDEAEMLSRFLEVLIGQSDIVLSQLLLMSNATTIEVIYSYSLREVLVVVPPISEQQQIMELITQETDKFDVLLSDAIKCRDLLKERRTALITAAVTGQIDVRGRVDTAA